MSKSSSSFNASAEANRFYVYVYIDPRNHEEFYYGKGCGSRKDVHLDDVSDTSKVQRIKAIEKEGLKPTIRVIAKGLTEQQALLVEKTLLWKLGKYTTNIASGHFANNFRPHNMLHKELPEFDFQAGLYYYNVGEGSTRNWDDYRQFGFISAGQGKKIWKDAMLGFNEGDIFVAYLKNHGFVGVGRIKEKAKMIRDVLINNKPLLTLPLQCKGMAKNSDNEASSEYVCIVEWIKTTTKENAKWQKKSNLYTTPLIRAALGEQSRTIAFIEKEFNVSLKKELSK